MVMTHNIHVLSLENTVAIGRSKLAWSNVYRRKQEQQLISHTIELVGKTCVVIENFKKL